MPFTREDFNNAMQELGQCEDDVTRRSLLVALSDNLGGVFDENETLNTAAQNSAAEIEKLQKANMELFLRVGNKRTPETEKAEEPPKRRRFEDLFNEKGEIK